MKQPRAVPPAIAAAVMSGAFIVPLDLSIVNIAFPAIEQSFPGASTATLSWVLSAYSVVFGALLLAGGRIADRSGRKRWFLRGLVIFAAGSAVCAAAPSVPILIGGRALQAAGGAVLLPASLALLLSAARPEARGPVVAMWGGVSALAVAAGPSLGAVLTEAGGWRWVFLVNVPVVVAVVALGRRHLDESAAGGEAPDVVGVLLVCATVAATALAITQGGDWGWTSPAVVGSLLGAAVLGPVAIRRASTHPSPAVDLTLLRSRTVALANAAMVVYAVAFFAMLLGSVLFLTGVWRYSALAAGLAITPGPLLVALLARPAGRLATRIGYRSVLVTGAASFTAGLVWYAIRLGAEADYLAEWLPASLLVGLGVALTFPVLGAAAVAGLPVERFAIGSAINQTARQIGAVFGVALLVAVVGSPATSAEALDAFRNAWLLAAVIAAVSGVISALHDPAAGRVSSAVLAPVHAAR